MTYASQVQDVLIPYTTREDTYHYYEERNYVNDINREYTEVLQTYDHDLKARETYTYGNGRASYLDNQEDTNYNYLTNQSGSVTGLTQDGEVVASSTYHLYGSTKETTDTTGNPYAYNGEARDVTGLDYLRARYYDSQAGTFLTEDSYPGELTTPLTQNGYAYVSNNPVNYTDPSGHFFKKLLKGAGKLLTKAKNAVVNFAKNTARAVVNVAKKAYNIGRNIVNTVVNTAKGVVNWAGTQINNAKNWAVQQRNNYHSAPSYQASSGGYGGGYHSPSSSHAYAQQQQAQARAQAEQRRQQHIRDEYSQSTGIKTTPKTREAKSLFRNWGKALKEMYTHVCKTAKRIKKQAADYVKKIDWKKVAVATVATVAAVAVTVATAGAAAPVIAGMVGTAGLSGLGAAVVTGVAVGAVSGAAGGAVNAFTTSVLSGDKPVTILKNTFTGMVNGAVTGGATGGLLGVVGSATSSVANPVARHVVDTAGETAVDTIVDASQGGQVTPDSIATSLAINTLSEGVSARGAKGAKADVPKNKPRGSVKSSSFLDGMSPEDAKRYVQWNKYAETGLEPMDRVKLQDWAYPPEANLYKNYKSVFDNHKYYNQKTGSINWPQHDGFDGVPKNVILEPGTKIDRYGSDYGTFTSPEGIPYEQRAVAPGTDLKPYSVFEIVEPLEVKAGKVAPWFNEPGGGIQYLLPNSVDKLLDDNIIRRIE